MGTAVTDGAPKAEQSDDSVLAGAFTEMASESGFDANKTFGDLEAKPDGASPTDGGASAAPKADAPTAIPGDDGAANATPPVVAAEGKPDAPPAVDPLAGTEPFTYGQGKTLPGVFRVPGEGLLVPEEHVASVQQFAERAELAEHMSRELATQYETFDRLSTWTVQDAQGKDQTLTGLQGLEALRIEASQTKAALGTLSALFQPNANGDYPNLEAFLAREELPDGKGGVRVRIVPHPDSLRNLLVQSELAEVRAEQSERQKVGTLRTPAPAAPVPINYATEASRLIGDVAKAAKLDASVLSPKQTELLAKQLKFHVIEQDGKKRVSPEWQELVQSSIAQAVESKKQAVAAETAGKHNAGMDKGRQPPKPVAKPAAAPTTKTDERKKADWHTPLESALSEMGIAR